MVYNNGMYIFSSDLNNILSALNTEGIVSGLITSEQNPVTTGVTVASGTAWVNGIKIIKETSSNISLTSAHATLPRKDIIVIDDSGNINAITGTATVPSPHGNVGPDTIKPVPPDIPSNNILIAEVYVPPGTSSISNSNITDRRIFIGSSLITEHSDLTNETHGLSGDIVGTTDIQTLANKTVTQPVLDENIIFDPMVPIASNNASAAIAGVPIGGVYRSNTDPSNIYIRTA